MRRQITTATAITWNWIDASACEIKSRSATAAEALRALDGGAKAESKPGRLLVATRAGWFAVN